MIQSAFSQDMVVQARFTKDFHLGVTKEEPDEAAVETEHDGTLYYIESHDEVVFRRT